MVPHVATIEEVLGPVLGPNVNRILAKNPPAPGEFVAIAPDNSRMVWRDERGQMNELNLRSRAVWFGEDEDDDDDDEHAA